MSGMGEERLSDQEWPVGKISPLGPAYHRTGPGTWHEHEEAGHEHERGDRVHVHRRFPLGRLVPVPAAPHA